MAKTFTHPALCAPGEHVTQKKRPIQLPGGAFLIFSRPLVMAIVNCTPDSFYPKSRTFSPEEAAEKALEAAAEGADIIDFGAESTRPGSVYIDAAEESRRLIPSLRLFRRHSTLPVSVDTRKAGVAREALDEGADIINDISALGDDPEMPGLCAKRGAAVVLMHGAAEMRQTGAVADNTAVPAGNGGIGKPDTGEPGTEPAVVGVVRHFLGAAAERARAAGISGDKIILDPGFGFGKTTEENLALLNWLATMDGGHYPLLVGLSRKRFIGASIGREPGKPEAYLAGTLAANAAALFGNADIIRVHDTAAAVDLVRLFAALRRKTFAVSAEAKE